MPKEDMIIKDVRVRYNGTFDFDLLYKKLRDWFLTEKYSDPSKNGEKKYSEKIKPNGKQIEIVWESSRSYEGGYYKITTNVEFFLNGINVVDVERDGRKIKLENGEIELVFNSKLTRNADKKWNESSMMHTLYEKYIIPDKIEGMKIECYSDTTKLIDEAKNFLNLYRF